MKEVAVKQEVKQEPEVKEEVGAEPPNDDHAAKPRVISEPPTPTQAPKAKHVAASKAKRVVAPKAKRVGDRTKPQKEQDPEEDAE